jgi:peptide subunit release factor RF-3
MILEILKLVILYRRGINEFQRNSKFSPEHFRYINNADPMKAKQLDKGVDQLWMKVKKVYTRNE